MKYQAKRIYSYMPGGDNAAWAWEDLGPLRDTVEGALKDFSSEKAKTDQGEVVTTIWRKRRI